MSFVDGALRIALTPLQWLRRGFWRIRRPANAGVHAVAVTPARRLVLVRLRYAPGWRIPGGARGRDEAPVDAALRELREEIGLRSFGEAELVTDIRWPTRANREPPALVIVRDAQYRPHRWSWEVERLCEADLDALPADMSPRTRRWLEQLRPLLEG